MGNAITAEEIGQKMNARIRLTNKAMITKVTIIIMTRSVIGISANALVGVFGIGGSFDVSVSVPVSLSVSAVRCVSSSRRCALSLSSSALASMANGARIAAQLQRNSMKLKMVIKKQNHCHLRWVLLTKNRTVELTDA
jgi:hypothetical protein